MVQGSREARMFWRSGLKRGRLVFNVGMKDSRGPVDFSSRVLTYTLTEGFSIHCLGERVTKEGRITEERRKISSVREGAWLSPLMAWAHKDL